MSDCLKAYVSNWSIMMKISETHRQVIDSVVHQKVTNVSLKRSAEDLLSRLEPIAEALDSVQGDGSSVSDAVAAWKLLESKLPCLVDKSTKAEIQGKIRTGYHFITHPNLSVASKVSRQFIKQQRKRRGT